MIPENPIITSLYRKDIDGLRAISVLLVLFYHLHWHFVKSGYIGVDIFFIISGYLITSHILKELESTNTFNFKHFYIKRIKRIVPALMLVLIVASILVFFIFYQTDIKTFFHSVIATLLFSSNIYFWRYFDADLYFSGHGSRLPLLHTWSLGIEEQFYIAWPIFLYFIFKKTNNRWMTGITFSIALISFFCYVAFNKNVNFVYFSPVTRAFELLIGALVCMLQTKKRTIISDAFKNFISFVSLLSIIFCACFLNLNKLSGIFVLIPCISAALLIGIGENTSYFTNKILSCSPMVFIGLISYSIYLWHWPLIAITNYLGYSLNFSRSMMIIVASIFLATLTWQYIEKPFRYKTPLKFVNPVLPLFMLCWIPELAFAFVMIKDPSLGYNHIPNYLMPQLSYYGLLKKKYGCFNESEYLYYPSEKYCLIGDKTQRNTEVLITGDSHAMANVGMLNVFLKDAHLKGYVFTQFQIGYKEDHNRYNNMTENYIRQNHPHYVVFARWWGRYVDDEAKNLSGYHYKNIMNDMVKRIQFCKKHHVIPVIVLDFPSLLNVSKVCGFTNISQNHCFNNVSSVLNQKIVQRLTFLRTVYPRVIFINPSRIICDKRNCYSSLEGHPLYSDGHDNSHLSYFGSDLIGKLYLKHIGNPFNQDKK